MSTCTGIKVVTAVGYDGRWTTGGIGRFGREVVQRLRRDGMQMRRMDVGVRIASPTSPLALARYISRCPVDVFWSPGFMPPWRPHIPAVITIHDLIHRKYGGKARRFYYDLVVRPLVRRVAGVMTVSDYSRAEIAAWLGPCSVPIHVVGNGVSDAFVPEGARLRLPAPYALYCGNHRSHKNLSRMIDAFARSAAARGLLLAMTGVPDESVNVLARRYGIFERIHWLGLLDETQLAEAYRGATLLIMASLAEGFGLPVVEAMACGTAVVCSSTTALGEVAGDAACLVDPTDVSSITEGIDRVAGNFRFQQTLSARGLDRAKSFRWDDVAARVLVVLKEAAGK